jgi:cytochrome P450
MQTHTLVSEIDLTSSGFIADPYPAYRRLREQRPVCWDERLRVWLISRHADADALLRDPRCSSDRLDAFMGRLPPDERAAAAPLRELLTHRLAYTDRPDHHRLRSLMQMAFTPRHVEMMRGVIQAGLDQLVARVKPRGRMDLIADLANPLRTHAVAGLLGLPEEDRSRFEAWTADIYAFVGLSAVPVVERARRATARVPQIRAYLAGLFDALTRQPGDNLLSSLLAVEHEGERLTEAELVSNVVGLINASHETTTNLIGNTVLALLRHPDQWQALVARPALVPTAVEEGLRYESPVQMVSRHALEDIPLGAVTVRKGEAMAILLGSANRDPEVIADPDRFDVTRAEVEHLAFAAGPHHCLGAALGRMTGQLALQTLIRDMPRLRLAGGELSWSPFPVFRGLLALPVEF